MLKKFLVVGVFWLMMSLVMNFTYTQAHEQAHVQIFAYYGLESDIDMGFFGLTGAKTVPRAANNSSVWLNMTQNRFDDMMGLHAQNEIVEYNIKSATFIIYTVIYMAIVTFILYSEDNKMKKERERSQTNVQPLF